MKSGNPSSWKPLGHSRPLTELLYVFQRAVHAQDVTNPVNRPSLHFPSLFIRSFFSFYSFSPPLRLQDSMAKQNIFTFVFAPVCLLQCNGDMTSSNREEMELLRRRERVFLENHWWKRSLLHNSHIFWGFI